MTTAAGIVQALPGGDFPNYANKPFPNLSLLSGLYLFGASGASSTPNLAVGATVDLTASGTPTYADGYVSLDSVTDYFSAGINVTNDQTLFLVVSKPADTEYLISTDTNWVILRGNGVGNNQVRLDGAFGGTCVATFNPGVDFGFLAITTIGTAGNPMNLYVGSGGALSLTSNGAMAAPLTASQVVIGPRGASVGGGTHKIAAAGFADSVLNATQLDEIYDYLRWYMPRRGIVVT